MKLNLTKPNPFNRISEGVVRQPNKTIKRGVDEYEVRGEVKSRR